MYWRVSSFSMRRSSANSIEASTSKGALEGRKQGAPHSFRFGEANGLSMIDVRMTPTIDGEWLKLEPIRVGLVPAHLPTPSFYVTAEENGSPLLRIDVYSYGWDCFYFQDAIFWKSNIVIGFGSHVHAISIADRSAVTIPLDSYYGHLYPTSEYLLIASGECLVRMEPDRSIRWQSDVLGIDGVIVDESGPEVIRGEGEWDPPGGWKPFTVDPATGLRTD